MVLPIIFAGTPQAAVPSLRALYDEESVHICGVLSRPDAPRGRGRKVMPSPVKEEALRLGLPIMQYEPSNPLFIEELHELGARAAAVVAYGRILRLPVLQALPLGWYNLHFSLLPQWRGAAPVQRAIMGGDTLTGTTVFRLDEGMDTGSILASSTTSIGIHETAGELLMRLAEDGAQLFAQTFAALDKHIAREQPQENISAQVAAKITVEDARIEWKYPAHIVDRQIRGCTPDPGAWTLFHPCGLNAHEELDHSVSSLRMTIVRAHIQNDDSLCPVPSLAPYNIYATKKQVWIGTGSLPLEIERVKVQGKKEMNAADWARGAHLTQESCVE